MFSSLPSTFRSHPHLRIRPPELSDVTEAKSEVANFLQSMKLQFPTLPTFPPRTTHLPGSKRNLPNKPQFHTGALHPTQVRCSRALRQPGGAQVRRARRSGNAAKNDETYSITRGRRRWGQISGDAAFPINPGSTISDNRGTRRRGLSNQHPPFCDQECRTEKLCVLQIYGRFLFYCAGGSLHLTSRRGRGSAARSGFQPSKARVLTFIVCLEKSEGFRSWFHGDGKNLEGFTGP